MTAPGVRRRSTWHRAQGTIVEFDMPEDGLYPMVTHAFNFVGRGALGLIQAGDGDALN